MRILIAVLVLLAAAPAFADDVYKWVDKDGVVHYGDKPPNKSAKPAELPPLQTYPGGKLPADLGKVGAPQPQASQQQPTAPPAAKLDVQIMSPAPDETLRSVEPVDVAVVISPGLAPGQKLVYFLDGQPQGAPTAATSQSVTMERGSHAISVAVVDAAGSEIARSPAVTVHMKPPTVKKSTLDDGKPGNRPAGFMRPQAPQQPRTFKPRKDPET